MLLFPKNKLIKKKDVTTVTTAADFATRTVAYTKNRWLAIPDLNFWVKGS